MAAAYQLPPLAEPLVVFKHMAAEQTTTLVLKERLFDDFDIHTLDGQPIMHVEAKLVSLHGRKKLYDPIGSYLFDITKEPLHWHATFRIQDEAKKQYMEVKSSFTRQSFDSYPPSNTTDRTQYSAPKPGQHSPRLKANLSLS